MSPMSLQVSIHMNKNEKPQLALPYHEPGCVCHFEFSVFISYIYSILSMGNCRTSLKRAIPN